jgi:cytidine deaminase
MTPAQGERGKSVPSRKEEAQASSKRDEATEPHERRAERELLESAGGAMTSAYAPYSGYTVGAALEGSSGRVYTGVNVENAAYGTSICAERVALFKAVSEGERSFIRLALVSNGVTPFPCGACRQALAEFSPRLEILLGRDQGVQRRALTDLLPDAFSLPPGVSGRRGGGS